MVMSSKDAARFRCIWSCLFSLTLWRRQVKYYYDIFYTASFTIRLLIAVRNISSLSLFLSQAISNSAKYRKICANILFTLVMLQLPMEKLKQIAPQLLEGETGWQMRDTYTECLAEFNRYEERIIMKWQERITSQLTEKLKQPVMVRKLSLFFDLG